MNSGVALTFSLPTASPLKAPGAPAPKVSGSPTLASTVTALVPATLLSPGLLPKPRVWSPHSTAPPPPLTVCTLRQQPVGPLKMCTGDFPGGPAVKNPPSNAGYESLIPGWGTKIPHAMQQLSPWALEPTSHNQRKLHAAPRTWLSQKISNFFFFLKKLKPVTS